MVYATEGSDGGALATPGGGRWGLRRRCAAAVRFGDFQNKKPATDFSVRALRFSRCWRYAGDLPDVSNRFQAVNNCQEIRRDGSGELKRLWPIALSNEKARAVFRCGLRVLR
jgi:hypothetical protein